MYRKEFERTTPEAMGIPSAAVQKLIEKLQAATEMHGFMLERHGAVVAECWWAPYHKDLVHICHSLGKSYTVTAIGALVTDGRLSMDDKIVDLFAEELKEYGVTPSENMKKLTVRHVATMTNGMSVHPDSANNFIRNYLTTEVDNEPGSIFMYNTTGSCMLGAIVEKVTGMHMKEYLTGRIFEKIGLEPDKLGWFRFRNNVDAACGVSATTENNLRLGMLYLNGGKWDGEQLLDPEWVKTATTAQSDPSVCNTHPDYCSGYGYQIWMGRKPGSYRFDGGHGQLSVMDTEHDLTIAIHQAGSMPSGTDGVLDIVNEFISGDFFADGAIPENPEALASLRACEASRAMPLPEARPVPASFADWNGLYKVTEGAFHVNTELRPFDTMNVYLEHYNTDEPDVKTISIDFKSPEVCELVFDHKYPFQVMMNGTFKPVHTESAIPAYYLSIANGYFEDENTLVLTMQFYQTCFRSFLRITKNGDELNIDVKKTTLHEAMPYIYCGGKAKRQ